MGQFETMSDLSSLPSVDRLLQSTPGAGLVEEYGHELTVKAIRQVLEDAREEIRNEGKGSPLEAELVADVKHTLRRWTAAPLHPVINATGVIIHTNLGRAPLSEFTLKTIADVGGNYSNLEFDMDTGTRGSRLDHAADLFSQLLDVESALVVNNNAAAVLLILQTLARGQKVVISRSQLIEIGGGFRIPDVMRQSGAILSEVGTTNRVHLSDYREAFDEDTVAVMRAHHSNYAIVGFTKEPEIHEIVKEAHGADVLVFDDLGSGALLDTAEFGLKHEPMVQESVDAGVDLVCFSGDKLLGGPQAGIILGRKDLIETLKREPLSRAIRADKTALAGLSATLTHYLKGEALEKIPVWKMVAADSHRLRERSERWQKEVGGGKIMAAESTVGGGSLPGEMLPTYVLAFPTSHPQRVLSALRKTSPPIIARVVDDHVIFDPRTVLERQDNELIQGIKEIERIHES